MSSLCLTLAEHSATSLQKKIVRYCNQLDLIEIRLDHLDDVEVPALPAARTAQFIATCRPPREGGEFGGTETERLAVLKLAVEAGFDWIDLEHDVPLAELPASSTRIVRSRHFFNSCPFELNEILTELAEAGGDAYKIAVRISTTSELVRLLSWVERLPAGLPRVMLGMGELGQGTRAPSLDRVRLLNLLFEHYEYAGVTLPCVVDDLATLEEYVAQSSLPFRGIASCDLLETSSRVDSVEEQNPEVLMEGVAEQFCQWTDIDPDREVIRGYLGGK